MHLMLFLLIFVSTICFGQTKYKSLIVVETYSDKNGDRYKHLVSYNFKKGNFISKDTLYTARDDKKDKYKNWFDYGYGSFIYKNRYAISGRGSVYDLNKKSLILDSGDDFVNTSSDSVFFYHDNYKGTGFWALDLKTANYVLLNRDKIDKDKRWSSDHKSYIKVLRTDTAFQVNLYKKGASNPILIDVTAVYIARFFFTKKIETYWLDNRSFLYASHANTFPLHSKAVEEPVQKNKTDTIKVYDFVIRDDASTKVTIFKYNIDKQRSEKITEIDSVTHSYRNGQFTIDGKKDLIYTTTNGGYYRLNLRGRKFSPYPYSVLPHEFSLEIKRNPKGQILKYKGLEIGSVKTTWNIFTSDKFIASKDDERIWVWNAYSKSVISFTTPYLCQIVGWVDNLLP